MVVPQWVWFIIVVFVLFAVVVFVGGDCTVGTHHISAR